MDFLNSVHQFFCVLCSLQPSLTSKASQPSKMSRVGSGTAQDVVFKVVGPGNEELGLGEVCLLFLDSDDLAERIVVSRPRCRIVVSWWGESDDLLGHRDRCFRCDSNRCAGSYTPHGPSQCASWLRLAGEVDEITFMMFLSMVCPP